MYVRYCDNKNVGRPNIVDLAIHMAKYQSVLTELQVRVKKLKVQRIVRGWLARRQLFFCCYWFNYGYGCGYGYGIVMVMTIRSLSSFGYGYSYCYGSGSGYSYFSLFRFG